MSGSRTPNPNVEDMARRNATLIAQEVEENPNSINQLHRRKYKCSDCKNEYDSFQALGGHRASHRRSVNATNLGTNCEVKIHKCRVCGEGFETGQALGGHMRKHWLPKGDKEKKGLRHGKKTTRETAMVVPYDHGSPSSVITSNSNGKEAFGYDLNLTPHENELKFGVQSDNRTSSEAS
ncbi:hypothetical protein LXL04_038880 [Taraxacum kok-saghyz]